MAVLGAIQLPIHILRGMYVNCIHSANIFQELKHVFPQQLDFINHLLDIKTDKMLLPQKKLTAHCTLHCLMSC